MYMARNKHKNIDIVKYVPFIFTDDMAHIDMHKMLSDCPQFLHLEENGYKINLVSAGSFSAIDCSVSGRSETLGLSSRPVDADIILHYDYQHGII